MLVQLVALSARRFAVCAPMQSPATVRSLSRFASCARTFATGVQNNAASRIWNTARVALNRAVVAPRHAARWLLDLKKTARTIAIRNRSAVSFKALSCLCVCVSAQRQQPSRKIIDLICRYASPHSTIKGDDHDAW